MADFPLKQSAAFGSRRFPQWVDYAWALLGFAAALALSLALPAFRHSDLLFLAAVVLSAWRWGRGPGIATMALSLFSIAEISATQNLARQLTLSGFAHLCIVAFVCAVVITLGDRRRQAEQKLRASERHFRVILEHTSDVITIVDGEGIIRYASPPVERLLGFNADEVVGRKFVEFLHPDDVTTATKFLHGQIELRYPQPAVELRARGRDGSYHMVESAANLLLDETGGLAAAALSRRQGWDFSSALVIASRDITERTRATESFRMLLESAPDAFVGTDTEGRIAVVNSQTERMFGYTREELLGQPIEILVPERFRARHIAHRANYENDPHTRPMGARGLELIACRKDGTEFPTEISLSPIRTERRMLIASVIRDVTERKKAELQRTELFREQAARVEAEAAQRRFYELVQDLDAVVWELDLETRRLTFVSRRATELLGHPPEYWLGDIAGWMRHVHPEDQARVQKFLHEVAEGGPPTLEYRAVAAGGRHLWLRLMVYVARDQHNRAHRLRGLSVDITERKQTEETLRTSEKLAATGRLAASIAHEINNPMGAVTNLLYLIETQPEASEQIRYYAHQGAEEMTRVAHITRQMLAFYRDSIAPAAVNIPEVLDATLELYARRIREGVVTVERQFEPVPALRAFPGEMRQVFSNLLLNALEATGPSGRIQVKVATSRDWADRQRMGIRVTFLDNGSGIRREDLPRVFDPFFTTKGENGTGLGLWVSLGIVQKHGGAIRVWSSARPGRNGTAFSIFLPGESALASADLLVIGASANKAKAS